MPKIPKLLKTERGNKSNRRPAARGEVPSSPRPVSWEGFFALDRTTDVEGDFLSEADRRQGGAERDPFEGPGV